jgi:hypothetical protein
MLEIDIGNLCTHCGEDTAFKSGNGLFVNRIPSEADGQLILGNGHDMLSPNWVDTFPVHDESIQDVTLVGYMCPNCQMEQCDSCGNMSLDNDIVDDEVICSDCLNDK